MLPHNLTALMQQASATLLALFFLSLFTLTLGLERLAATLRARRRLAHGAGAVLRQLREDADVGAAQAVNRSLPSHPATQLLHMALAEPDPQATPGTQLAPLHRAARRILRQGKRRVWLLGSVGTLAPFVGLMGTVLGIMEAFRAIAAQGNGGFQVVSGGVSEALLTTAAGIFVAIEAVALFNTLQVVLGQYAAELFEALEEIEELRARGQRAGA